MTWSDVLTLIGVAGLAVGVAGGGLALLRLLPLGENWHLGPFF